MGNATSDNNSLGAVAAQNTGKGQVNFPPSLGLIGRAQLFGSFARIEIPFDHKSVPEFAKIPTGLDVGTMVFEGVVEFTIVNDMKTKIIPSGTTFTATFPIPRNEGDRILHADHSFEGGMLQFPVQVTSFSITPSLVTVNLSVVMPIQILPGVQTFVRSGTFRILTIFPGKC